MNDTWAHIGEVRILKELIQQLAGDLLQCEAVCRYLRGEVERLGKMAAMADEVCPKCGCTFYYDEHGWTHEVTHE